MRKQFGFIVLLICTLFIGAEAKRNRSAEQGRGAAGDPPLCGTDVFDDDCFPLDRPGAGHAGEAGRRERGKKGAHFAAGKQGQHQGKGPGQLNSNRSQKVLAYLRQHLPELATKLSELEEKHPQHFYRQMAKMKKRVLRLERMQRRFPAVFTQEKVIVNMEFDVFNLVLQYRATQADSTERSQVLTSLRALHQELFELKLQQKERRIERLEQRISTLKQDLETRRGQKEAIIDQRIKELLGTEDQLKW